MSSRKLTIDHDGKTYAGQMARIDSTSFGYEDHGILTAMLHCSWPGGGIGVGGYCLDKPSETHNRKGTAYGLDHLITIMRTVGVSSWEDLPGNQVIVLFEDESRWGSTACGIANALDEDRVLDLRTHAETWREVTS